MGIYTNFEAKIRLHKDTPEDIIQAIRIAMCYDTNMDYAGYQQFDKWCKERFMHPFFECRRWQELLCSTNGSSILGGKLIKSVHNYTILLDTEFKEYDDEIKHFLDFVKPYIVGRKKKQYIGKSMMDDYRHQGYTYYAVDCSQTERIVLIY